MENILKKQGYNLKHVHQLYLVPSRLVDTIPEPNYTTKSIALNNIITYESTAWIVFNFTFGTCTFTEKENDVNGVPVWEISIKAFVAKEALNRWINFDEMEGQEFMAIVRDFNNFSKLVGYINIDGERVGLRLRKVYTTNPVNGYSIELYMESHKRPVPGSDVNGITVDSDESWMLPD